MSLSPTRVPVRRRAPVTDRRCLGVLGVLIAAILLVTSPAAMAQTYGSHQVVGSILDKYKALGGPSGILGWPRTSELATPRVPGRYNHFDGGSVYWSPSTGAHVVRGAIRDRWAGLGWEGSSLGFPTTDETPARGGAFNDFGGGSIYWSPSTGAQVLRGAIRDKWRSIGGGTSVLGYPTTDERPLRTGAVSSFRGGSIYWSRLTGAHVVGGDIRALWGAMNAEAGPLGYPVSDEYAIPGGRRSDFQNGSIVWAPGAGARLNELTVSGGPGATRVPLALGTRAAVQPLIADVRNTDPSGKAFTAGLQWDALICVCDSAFSRGTGTFTRVDTLNGHTGLEEAIGLRVSSGGTWTVRLRSYATAEQLKPGGSRSGTGDREARNVTVLHYVGGPTNLLVSHGDQGTTETFYFDIWNASVDPIGSYGFMEITPTRRTVPLAGEAYLTIYSSVPWTISAPPA